MLACLTSAHATAPLATPLAPGRHTPQAAHLSGRVLLLPNLPCHTAWLHSPDTLHDSRRKDVVCIAPTFWGADIYR